MFRRKPAQLGLKLLILGLFGCLLAVWVINGWPCVFRHATGIPCISCGMSRAWLAALRLELGTAFYYHPMFWSVPVLVLFVLWDGCLFRNPRLNRWLLALIPAAWLICYGIRLVVFLSGGDVF